jgi:hypothetical protein
MLVPAEVAKVFGFPEIEPRPTGSFRALGCAAKKVPDLYILRNDQQTVCICSICLKPEGPSTRPCTTQPQRHTLALLDRIDKGRKR